MRKCKFDVIDFFILLSWLAILAVSLFFDKIINYFL